MAVYRFEYYDNGKQISMEFTPESETWSHYTGPMSNFFDFLKGIGYNFGEDSEIGVMDKNGEFHSADLLG